MKEEDYDNLCESCKRDLDEAHSTRGKRQIGRTAAIQELLEKAKAAGKTVLVIGPNTPRPRLLGAAMPPFGDPELDAVDEFRDTELGKAMWDAAMPKLLPSEIYGKARIFGYIAKSAKPISEFDPRKLHFALRDEMGMRGDIDADWAKLRLEFTPRHFPPINDSTMVHGAYILNEAVKMCAKMPEIREEPKVKHNPKPSRMAFLDGLQRGKKRY